MKRILSACGLLLFFLLSACSPASPATKPTAIATASATLPLKRATSTQIANMPCMLLHASATPAALGAEFESRGHTAGPADAAVTIVEFGDYQCPACALLEASLRQIRQAHPQDVRLVYVNTPQSAKDKDLLAMQAAESADLQGKYWEMHDLLFSSFNDWASLAPAEFEAWVAGKAAGLGLDPAKFKADFQGQAVQDMIQQAAKASANQSIVPPILFVNSSTAYTGLVNFASLDTVVRLDVLTSRQFSACPKWVIDTSKQYIVHLQTARGEATLELFADKAPLAVNNFVFLAQSGWYDNITFYRVVPGQLAETGDPSDTGMGNPGYIFSTEIVQGLNFDQAGMVLMENSGVNTNGSRFAITLGPAPQMDGQFTIIGQVLTGLDVLKTLAARDPQPGSHLAPGDTLIRTTIEER